MRIRDELRKRVQALDFAEALQSDVVVDAVLDKLIDRLSNVGFCEGDLKSDWTRGAERWLRDIRNGMR